MKKKYRYIFILVVFVLGLVIAFGIYKQKNEIALYINNEEISDEEYNFLASCSTPYLEEYMDSLFDTTTRKVLLIRAEQILLKESGIIDDYSFDGFKIKLDTENAKRKKMLENNQKVYGPKQYDGKVYFDYYYSNCREAYMKTMLSKTTQQNKESIDLEELYKEKLLNEVTNLEVRKD